MLAIRCSCRTTEQRAQTSLVVMHDPCIDLFSACLHYPQRQLYISAMITARKSGKNIRVTSWSRNNAPTTFMSMPAFRRTRLLRCGNNVMRLCRHRSCCILRYNSICAAAQHRQQKPTDKRISRYPSIRLSQTDEPTRRVNFPLTGYLEKRCFLYERTHLPRQRWRSLRI